jgi:hypothetical protein
VLAGFVIHDLFQGLPGHLAALLLEHLAALLLKVGNDTGRRFLRQSHMSNLHMEDSNSLMPLFAPLSLTL